jgi:hypothetical protein
MPQQIGQPTRQATSAQETRAHDSIQVNENECQKPVGMSGGSAVIEHDGRGEEQEQRKKELTGDDDADENRVENIHWFRVEASLGSHFGSN